MKKVLYVSALCMLALIVLSTASAYAIGLGDQVMVSWKGKWYPSVIIQQSDANFRIHYLGYDNSWDEWVTLGRIRFQVSWKGQWYPATALESSGSRVRIHYTGYDSSWDEWVTLDRIRAY